MEEIVTNTIGTYIYFDTYKLSILLNFQLYEFFFY